MLTSESVTTNQMTTSLLMVRINASIVSSQYFAFWTVKRIDNEEAINNRHVHLSRMSPSDKVKNFERFSVP
jgi:hypothetical protein